jgi:hypothetical protein
MSDSDSDDRQHGTAAMRQLHRDMGDEFGAEAGKLPLQLHGVSPFARLSLRPVFAQEQKVLHSEAVKEKRRQVAAAAGAEKRRRKQQQQQQKQQQKEQQEAQDQDDPFAAAAPAADNKKKDTAAAAPGAKKNPKAATAKKSAAKRRQRAKTSGSSSSSSSPSSSSDDDDDETKKARSVLLFCESNPRLPLVLSNTRARMNCWSGQPGQPEPVGPTAVLHVDDAPEHSKTVRLCSCCGRMARYRCPDCFAGAKGSSSAVFSDPDGGLVCGMACLDTHKMFRCGKHVV